jgi:hypothetical protein
MCRVTDGRARGAVAFAGGALAFMTAHLVIHAEWTRWFGPEYVPWFLNSGRANAFMVGWLLGTSLIAGVAGARALTFAAGACAAMTIVLFTSPGGPGTIFPIVLAFGGLLILGSSALGAWIGGEIRRIVRG